MNLNLLTRMHEKNVNDLYVYNSFKAVVSNLIDWVERKTDRIV